ncbi:hypothetical protein FS837_012569 [Tulasnella sp. UAMH 9824]|nr:hypothetical protein FS837_012569 [Tulasnella sp. UAMH 9824]
MFRLKHLWDVFPLPAKIKLVWNRLTSSRLATFYFIFTIAHCLIQVGLQFTAHHANHSAATLLEDLVTAAGLESRNFTLYDPDLKILESCWGIPTAREGDGEKCITIWAATGEVLPSEAFQDPQPTRANVSKLIYSGFALNIFRCLIKLGPTSSTNFQHTIPIAQPTPSSVESEDDSDSESDDGSDDGDSDTDSDSDDDELTPAPGVVGKRDILAGFTSFKVHRRQANSTVDASTSIRAVGISPIPESTDNTTIASLQVVGIPGSGPVTLSRECVEVLRWPLQTLRDTQREDIVFVIFQFWVLGMSFVALLNESIPHIIAALLTHVLATMWSGYQLAGTQSFRSSFITLTVNGACKGVNLLPGYWQSRGGAEISILALNCVALLVSALLSWKIIKVFGWATFRRIGADRKINGIYTVVLLMTVFLQLSLFFIVTTMALWIDQLCFGAIGKFASHMMLYRAIDIVIFIMLIPWLALGWFGVRRESKMMMYAFFAISVFLLGQWASSFASSAWKLTFVNWRFFAIMSIVAALLTVGVTIFGVICFRNFGEGLGNYLKPQEDLAGEDFERITKGDLEHMGNDRSSTGSYLDEKIAFPPPASVVPAFSTPFGTVDRDPVPVQHMTLRDFAPTAMVSGPRPRSKTNSPPPQLASPERVLVGPARRGSGGSSTFSRDSDSNPFHLAEKLSYNASSNRQNTSSRWSKDSSNDQAAWKRWLIE